MLRKWLGGRRKPSPELAEALAELDHLAQRKAALAVPCAVLKEVLPALFAEPIQETALSLNAGQIKDKCSAGLPLLQGEPLHWHVKSLRGRWRAICQAVQKQNDAASALAEKFDALDPSGLIGEVLAGRPETLPARAAMLNLDPALMATVLRLTAFPVLANYATAVVSQNPTWEHGYCPICGSGPLLGEFRGLEQTRFLRCGWCASSWPFPRLRCPFCDNRDHRLLGYFHVEGEENRHRAATCDGCRRYVKMVSTLTALSSPQLLVADLATVHLDLVAGDRGYSD